MVRKPLAFSLVMGLTVLAGGCATTQDKTAREGEQAEEKTSVSQWVLPQHVENWLAEQEYGLVLDWLDTLPHDEPGFESVKQIHAEIRQMARDYEHNILKEINKEQQRGNMDAVFLTLNTALRKLPNSQLLKDKRKKLFSKQVRQIAYLKRQLLIARAKYLITEAQTREQLAQIDWDNPQARWNHKRAQEELKTTSIELLQCGRQSFREGFLKQAQSCVDLAGRMQPSKEQTALARQIEQNLELKRKQREARRLAEQERLKEQTIKVSTDQLQQLAKRALAQGQLRAALNIIDEIISLEKDNVAVQKLKAAVERKLASRVTALMKRGNNYYKNGSIEDAKRDWEEVLRLDPDNKEAKNNVERAERVLEKLLELQGEENS